MERFQGTQPWLPPFKPTVVISPHPDDETLGAGGLIAGQCKRGLPVTVIAVTDGDAAYPDATNLAAIRKIEQQNALRVLGVDPSSIVRLGLPDSKVSAHEERLAELLIPLLSPESLVVTPWALDWHPDHEACGRAVEKARHLSGAETVSYMFWTWHSKTIESLDGLAVRRLELDASLLARKQAALRHHRSQLEYEGGSPILPERLLLPAKRPFEIFIVNV
jgi:LmbE family N-acetylglucosaminyl deacetylase